MTKSAILRLTPAVRPKLTQANALRLDQTLGLIHDNGQANLAEVLNALYPRQPRTTALSMLRQFRAALTDAAREADVRLALKTDGQTRAAPSDRIVWFEGEDRVTEEVTRWMRDVIGSPNRSPQDAIEITPAPESPQERPETFDVPRIVVS